MSRIVESITFDVMYDGVWYRGLDFGYHNDPDVTEDYIKSEDGPWSMVEVGKEVIDFQIWADPDNPDVPIMSACRMSPHNGVYSRGPFIGSEDIDITNINIKYKAMEENKTKVCTKCGRELSVSEFTKKKGTPDGLSYICKDCLREYNHNYFKRKKEERLNEKDKGKMLEIIPESIASEEVLMEFLLKVQPRYLMKALYKRGYDGDLTYTETHTIRISKIGRD